MTRKALLSLSLFFAVLFVPSSASAKTVCTQEYGQPVVCEEVEEVKGVVHETKDTALGGMDFVAIGSGLMFTSGILLALSKRKTSGSILIK
jgi:hypothetical protein